MLLLTLILWVLECAAVFTRLFGRWTCELWREGSALQLCRERERSTFGCGLALCVCVLSQDVVGFDADAYYHSSSPPVVLQSSHFMQR